MKRKLKYKIGDVLERWSSYDNYTHYFLIVDILPERGCYMPRCRVCKATAKVYVLKRVDGDDTVEYDTEVIDMIGWNDIDISCRRGWRRIA
jgi:hypothetical protein